MIPIRTRSIQIPPRPLIINRLKEIEILLTNGYWDYKTIRSLIVEKKELESRLTRPVNQDRPPIGQPVSSDTTSHIVKERHMFIEFETDTSSLVFRMVREGQLFVDKSGNLCQRSCDDENEGWCIADSQGRPDGQTYHYSDDELIKKILPEIKKITF